MYHKIQIILMNMMKIIEKTINFFNIIIYKKINYYFYRIIYKKLIKFFIIISV